VSILQSKDGSFTKEKISNDFGYHRALGPEIIAEREMAPERHEFLEMEQERRKEIPN
jgi:hypothetical protein